MSALRRLLLPLLALPLLLCGGCATITSSEMQLVSLSTQTRDGHEVDKARCTLENDKGSWEMDSPGVIYVRRSPQDLVVECRKAGLPDGILHAISRAARGMYGNILFGGVPGALIDHKKGTGYDYPDELPVEMGSTLTVDRRNGILPVKEEPGEAEPEKRAAR